MKEKNVTIEKLAGMVQRGFENTATKDDIKRLEKRQAVLEKGQATLEKGQATLEKGQIVLAKGQAVLKENQDEILLRLGRIEGEIKQFVSYDEFEDLMARVKYLESHLGIEAGK